MPVIPRIRKNLEQEASLRYMASLTSLTYTTKPFLSFSKFKVQNKQTTKSVYLWLDRSQVL